MNWCALRFFVMVIVLCVCVIAAAWALNLGKSDGEFYVCYPEPNTHDHGKIFSLANESASHSYTYRIIEIEPKDRHAPDYDPNYPDTHLPKRKYSEQPRVEKDYKIIPAKEHLLRIDDQ